MTAPDPSTFETDEPVGFDNDPATTEFDILRRNREDMFRMLFDPESVPKAPTGVEEPQSKRGGTEPVDMLTDHSPVDDEIDSIEDDLGLLDDELDVGLDDLEVEE